MAKNEKSNGQSMLNKTYIKIVLVLFIVNIVLAGFYFTVGQNKTLTISPDKFNYKVASDQVVGGRSQARLIIDQDKAIMSCTLIASDYAWPYCEITINLTDDIKNGLDLSSFDRVFLDIDYQGPQSGTERVRVNVRNFEPTVFNQKDDNTLKYNGIEYHPGFGMGGKDIGFDKFQVLTWWLFDYNVPIEESGVKLDNVPMIQIATDSGSVMGTHTITVNKIIFKGQYLKPRWFAYSLLAIWVIAALTFLVYELLHSRQRMQKIVAHAKHLDQLNQDLESKYTEVSALAVTDELTGAINRFGIRDWLDNVSRRVRWGTAKLSIIYVDLDHFKAINDTFGHNVGDLILREFVRLIHEQLRDDDQLVRWGGEEFIIFCPNAPLEGATRLAERIRQVVEQHQWPEIGSLTCSCGVTEMVSGENAIEMTARADEALYKAKNNGRNRVEVMLKLA
ncbi:GGDEF domain-containing protein [Vibrio gangliei]|uniref:GGDEF domain-containing protein n=1 Tax=Vibrio gangliei TaxID=2077090 RepID=UPI000D012865|nr:GGDEF domain-containing protein [Vibrio gangliei]